MSDNKPSPDPNETPVSVIVGGMHGLTRNVTQSFHDLGHRVIVVDKRTEPDEGFEAPCHHSIQADLLDVDGLPSLAEKIRDVCGHVTNMVFGLKYRGPEETLWQSEFDLGLTVPKVLIEELVPSFASGGAIVLISSTCAYRVTPGLPVSYHCVKSATEHMVRFYAWNLGSKGIRINGISPGYMVKDESVPYFLEERERVEKVNESHPVGRFGRGVDVANAVVFLCSEKSSFVTGQILTLDGGLSLENPGYT